MAYAFLLVFFFLQLCASFAFGAESNMIDAAKRKAPWFSTPPHGHPEQQTAARRLQQKYPFIKADLVRLGGTAMVSRILTEAQAGASQFDVAVGISPSLTPMRERNLIAPYMSPEFANLYDDLYDAKGYWSTVYLNTLVLGYNTKVISRNDLPKTYDDLLKPQYKQKFIIDIENHDVFVALSQEWGQEKAINYFKGLAKQEPVFLRGNTNRANFVSVGERSMTFVYAASHRAHEADRRAGGLDSAGAGRRGIERRHAVGQGGASQLGQTVYRLFDLEGRAGVSQNLSPHRPAQRREARPAETFRRLSPPRGDAGQL